MAIDFPNKALLAAAAICLLHGRLQQARSTPVRLKGSYHSIPPPQFLTLSVSACSSIPRCREMIQLLANQSLEGKVNLVNSSSCVKQH